MTENRMGTSLEAEELMERMTNRESFLLIDTLTGSRFEKVHLPGLAMPASSKSPSSSR